MKCIKNKITGVIIRTNDADAAQKVKNKTHEYANKADWKAQGRLLKETN